MIGLLTLVLMQVWEPGTPMPTPGYGFACAAVGSRVYAIGGVISEADSTVPRLAVEAYDVATDSWIVGLASLPGPKGYAGCAELNGRIYVIGGWDGHSELSRVDRYDPATNTWDTVAPLPWPRWGLAGCAYGGAVYAIGGYSIVMGYQRPVARFSPDSGLGHWDVVESLRTPRTTPAAAIAAGKMCAVGGKYFSSLPSFESYMPGWHQWIRTMHDARSGAAAVGWGKWLCAIGGQNGSGPLSSVEVIDVDSGAYWLRAAPLPSPRVFCGAAVVDSSVIILGGRDRYGAVGLVDKADSTLFRLSGIEERQDRKQLRKAPSWATVANGRARITCRSAVLYDGSGRRVFAGAGPVDVKLGPGVYFVRVTDNDDRLVTGTITVVR